MKLTTKRLKEIREDADPMGIVTINSTLLLLDCVEEMRTALSLYADPFSWRTRSGKVGITALTDGSDFESIDNQPTGGKKAREVLARWFGDEL